MQDPEVATTGAAGAAIAGAMVEEAVVAGVVLAETTVAGATASDAGGSVAGKTDLVVSFGASAMLSVEEAAAVTPVL